MLCGERPLTIQYFANLLISALCRCNTMRNVQVLTASISNDGTKVRVRVLDFQKTLPTVDQKHKELFARLGARMLLEEPFGRLAFQVD